MRADDIWMSMDYGRHSCHITVIIYNPSEQGKEAYFNSLHQVLRDMGLMPRSHFGKYHNVTTQELAKVYPKYADFKHARSKLDPKGVFLNSMLTGLF